MRIIAAVLVMVEIIVSARLHAQERGDEAQRFTLADAIQISGKRAAALPIALATSLHEAVSPGAEAWTLYGADGQPRQIFVYTESAVFRCANRSYPDWQCRLKLASIIVHEAWHFTKSRDDAQAYEAQIAFLVWNGASSVVVGSVRRSRDYALARQRAGDGTTPRESRSGRESPIEHR